MRSKFLQQVLAKIAVAAQSVSLTSGAATVKGTAIAHVGDNGALGVIRSALVHIQTGVSGSAAMTGALKIQESDDTTDGDFTDVTLKTGQTLPSLAITTSAGGEASFFLRVAGLKKYWRVVLTLAGTGTDSVIVASSALLGDGSLESLPRGTTPPVVYEKA